MADSIESSLTQNAIDTISRQAAIDAVDNYIGTFDAIDVNFLDGLKTAKKLMMQLPSAQAEVIPHRNYKYLSDYWCECGWHLGKKGEVKYCADCGKRVKWDD